MIGMRGVFLFLTGPSRFVTREDTEPSEGSASTVDWPTFQHDIRRSGYIPESGPEEELSIDWTYSVDDTVSGTPVIVNDRIFFGSYDGHVYCLDSLSGDLNWSLEVGGWLQGTPTIENGVLYIAANDHPNDEHRLYAIDIAEGAVQWQCDVDAGFGLSPAVTNEYVCVTAWDDSLYSIAADDGTVISTIKTSGCSESPPAIIDGTAFVGSQDCVQAIDIERGAELWRTDTKDVSAAPTVDDGTLYVNTLFGDVLAMDADTGEMLWQQKTEGDTHMSLGVDNETVYVGCSRGFVYAFEKRTGESRWMFDTEDHDYINSSPVITPELLYTTSEAGYLLVINKQAGKEVFRLPVEKNEHKIEYGGLALSGGCLYVSTETTVNAII